MLQKKLMKKKGSTIITVPFSNSTGRGCVIATIAMLKLTLRKYTFIKPQNARKDTTSLLLFQTFHFEPSPSLNVSLLKRKEKRS